MTLKEDYYQGSINAWDVFIDKKDDCVILIFNAKDEKNEVVPIEIRMSRSGACNLGEILFEAVNRLNH